MPTSAAYQQPAEQYLQTVMRMASTLDARLGSIVPLAEAAARRLVAGGQLFAIEDGGAFVSEITGRAGGLMMVRGLEKPEAAGPGDVVLAATSGLKPAEQRVQLARLKDRGAMVILFGSSESPLREQVTGCVENTLPAGTAPCIRLNGGAPICPASTVANITAAWAFLGEVVGACTRLGRMPTMYQSVYIPSSQVWNPRYAGRAFHDDRTINPLEPGSIGGVFLSAIRHCLLGIERTQLGLFRRAGEMCADALAAGHRVWYFFNGHHLRDQYGLPGDPGLLTLGDREKPMVGEHDVFFWLGYYDLPEQELAIVGTANCRSIWICGARSNHPIPLAQQRVVIDPYWEFGDAVVAIPEYDVRILPPSGVIQTVCLWMLVGETARAHRQRARPQDGAQR